MLEFEPKVSHGAGWARSKIATLYRGEKYYLQLDSHHMFVRSWDVVCIELLNQLAAKVPHSHDLFDKLSRRCRRRLRVSPPITLAYDCRLLDETISRNFAEENPVSTVAYSKAHFNDDKW